MLLRSEHFSRAEEFVRAFEGVPEERRAAIEQMAHIDVLYRQFEANPDTPFVPKTGGVAAPAAEENDEDPAQVYQTLLDQQPEKEVLPTMSTITMVSGIGSRVDLSLFYEELKARNMIGLDKGSRVLNLRYGSQPMLGAWPPVRSRRPKKQQPKAFFNQATMDIQLASNPNRFVSCKLFENGMVQLSGNKSMADAKDVMEVLLGTIQTVQAMEDEGGVMVLKLVPVVATALRRIFEETTFWTPERRRNFLLRVRAKRYGTQILRFCVAESFSHLRRMVYEPASLGIQPILIAMINSDFRSGKAIDRRKLSRLIHDEYPDIKYKYDPTSYSGVILKFPSGCQCRSGCSTLEAQRLCAKAAEKSKERNTCRIITVICFHQGEVILTGARSYQMVYEGYKFMKNLYESRQQDIRMEATSEDEPIRVNFADLQLM